MKRIDKVCGWQKQIKALSAKIEKVQKACLHCRVEVKEFPDWNCGLGRSSRCLDCGKPLGCSTGTLFLGKKTTKRKVLHCPAGYARREFR